MTKYEPGEGTLEQITEKTVEIPTLPTVATKVLELVNFPSESPVLDLSPLNMNAPAATRLLSRFQETFEAQRQHLLE